MTSPARKRPASASSREVASTFTARGPAFASSWAEREAASSQPSAEVRSRYGAGGPGATAGRERRRVPTTAATRGAPPSTTPYGPADATPRAASAMHPASRKAPSVPRTTP